MENSNKNTKSNSLQSKYFDLLGLTLFTQFFSSFRDEFYLVFTILPGTLLYYGYGYLQQYMKSKNGGVDSMDRQMNVEREKEIGNEKGRRKGATKGKKKL